MSPPGKEMEFTGSLTLEYIHQPLTSENTSPQEIPLLGQIRSKKMEVVAVIVTVLLLTTLFFTTGKILAFIDYEANTSLWKL